MVPGTVPGVHVGVSGPSVSLFFVCLQSRIHFFDSHVLLYFAHMLMIGSDATLAFPSLASLLVSGVCMGHSASTEIWILPVMEALNFSRIGSK